MFTGIVFFGASSSQAVHPERLSVADLAAAAAKGILKDARELVMASVGTGAGIGSTRGPFSSAAEKLKNREAAATAALANQAVRSVSASQAVLADLYTGFEFVVAANAAEQAGIDIRQAVSIYEAATAELGRSLDVFGSSWQNLGESVKAADAGERSRYVDILKHLHGPARALDFAKGE